LKPISDRKALTPISYPLTSAMVQSLILFIIAGLCELGGGYLIWLMMRDGRSAWFGAIGVLLLGLYGGVATLQPIGFGRTYAAYGGIFIGLSVLWGWIVDRVVPDRFDILGAIVALVGVAIILYGPRT
jgi:small multidrug resistance family-3 protein